MFSCRYGGKHVMTVGMLVATVATMLTPVLARVDVALAITARVLVGMATVRVCLFFFWTRSFRFQPITQFFHDHTLSESLRKKARRCANVWSFKTTVLQK